MKTILLMISMLSCSVISFSAQAGECGGCEQVQAVTEKLEHLGSADAKIYSPLLDQASKAILAMPREKGDKLTIYQVHDIVQLLAQTDRFDNVNMVIEDIEDLIVANKVAFKDELKKLPPKRAISVANSMKNVVDEMYFGQDSQTEAQPEVHPTPH